MIVARLLQPLIAWLLHLANSNPPCTTRTGFYDLKKKLLNKFATIDGGDIQHIVKKCWGTWDHWDDASIPCGPNCKKCGGSGIYYQTWWSLIRYKWCGFCFHSPDFQMYSDPKLPVTIEGRIEHKKYGRLSQEACIWLFLLCGEWRLLWQTLTASRACGWVWYPLLNIQKVTMELSMRLRRHQCYRCDKWFTTWGSGWMLCWKCQKEDKRLAHYNEPPF